MFTFVCSCFTFLKDPPHTKSAIYRNVLNNRLCAYFECVIDHCIAKNTVKKWIYKRNVPLSQVPSLIPRYFYYFFVKVLHHPFTHVFFYYHVSSCLLQIQFYKPEISKKCSLFSNLGSIVKLKQAHTSEHVRQHVRQHMRQHIMDRSVTRAHVGQLHQLFSFVLLFTLSCQYAYSYGSVVNASKLAISVSLTIAMERKERKWQDGQSEWFLQRRKCSHMYLFATKRLPELFMNGWYSIKSCGGGGRITKHDTKLRESVSVEDLLVATLRFLATLATNQSALQVFKKLRVKWIDSSTLGRLRACWPVCPYTNELDASSHVGEHVP